jgi:hypothetical protein
MDLPINYRNSHWTIRKIAREEYVKEQGGKCWYCQNPLSDKPRPDILSKKVNEILFPKGFFDWPVHLHHCHKTHMTIGAVHNHCNAVLWQYHKE